MADIKRLINKKGWTGKELGIIELTNMAVMFSQTIKGEEVKPIIESSQLKKMVNQIEDPYQGREYNRYISIHEWLSIKYNIAQTQLQQAQLQYNILEEYLTQAILTEDVFRYVEQLPIIMTQKQYDDFKAERIEAYFKDEDGKEIHSNIFNLIERAITFYLHKLKTEPAKPNPLKTIRKKYINQPVKSRLILDRYNDIAGEGYYTLEDGRRSDQMTLEEWQEALTTPKTQEALMQMKATDGKGTEYTTLIAQHRLINRYKVIFNGGTDEEADEAQRKADCEQGFFIPCEWHTYTEPPTDLTKWDIIEQELLLEFYPASLDGENEYTAKNFLASMEDFKQEFSELVAAVLADMDKKYFYNDEIKASNLSLEEWETTLISYRRLYQLDFYGERTEAESDLQIFDGNIRALTNGVAILRPSDICGKSLCIDKNGYFIEPEIINSLKENSLEAFFTESEEYADNTETIESTRETLLESYQFLIGYNYAIDQIAKIHDVPELKVFKMNVEALANKIEALNSIVFILYNRIRNTDYKDKELQAKKLQVLKDFFQPIEYKSITIPEEVKKEADELITSFKAFEPETADYFYQLLFTKPTGEGA